MPLSSLDTPAVVMADVTRPERISIDVAGVDCKTGMFFNTTSVIPPHVVFW